MISKALKPGTSGTRRCGLERHAFSVRIACRGNQSGCASILERNVFGKRAQEALDFFWIV